MIFMGELHRDFFSKSGFDPSIFLESKQAYSRYLINGEVENFELEYCWLAEIFYFQKGWASKYRYKELVISIIKSKTWCKSLILIPNLSAIHTLDEIQAHQSNVLDIDCKLDLFVPQMQSVCIRPQSEPVFDGDDAYRCNVRYQSNIAAGGFYFEGPLKQHDKAYEAIWLSLLATVKAVSDLSNDQIIKEFVQDT